MDEERNDEIIEVETDDDQKEETTSKSNFGLGVAVGTGLTLVTIACVKKVRKLLSDRKAKKEAERFEASTDEVVDDAD